MILFKCVIIIHTQQVWLRRRIGIFLYEPVILKLLASEYSNCLDKNPAIPPSTLFDVT